MRPWDRRREARCESCGRIRDFPGAGLTALFDHQQADVGPFAYPVDLCSTDRVSFCRTGDRRRAPVPLDEVPELAFSEAMRDVDLFVSVTSIALDPGGPTAARTPTSPTGGNTHPVISPRPPSSADDKITDPAITRQLNAR